MSFLRMETWGRRDGTGVRMSSVFPTAELKESNVAMCQKFGGKMLCSSFQTLPNCQLNGTIKTFGHARSQNVCILFWKTIGQFASSK